MTLLDKLCEGGYNEKTKKTEVRTLTKRVSAIDWIKFVLAGWIVCLHYGELVAPITWGGHVLFSGSYLAVEGFFLISGFLFMRSVYGFEAKGRFPSCPRVVFHRYMGIAYWLIPAVILDAAIVATGVEYLSLDEVLSNIPRLLFEVVPLQMAGFSAWNVTGVSWYISSLLLGVLLFYPLAKRNPRVFALEICPIIAVVAYGLLYHLTGKLCNPAEWLYDCIRKGLLRGLADMAVGCFLYECVRRTKDEVVSIARRILYTVAAAIAAGACALIMLFTTASFYDFVFVLFAFAFLYLALGQKTVFALFLNHEWTKHVGTVSTVVFLVHFPLARYFAANFPPADAGQYIGTYLAYVAGASVVVFAIGSLFKALVSLAQNREDAATDTGEPEELKEENVEEKEAF